MCRIRAFRHFLRDLRHTEHVHARRVFHRVGIADQNDVIPHRACFTPEVGPTGGLGTGWIRIVKPGRQGVRICTKGTSDRTGIGPITVQRRDIDGAAVILRENVLKLSADLRG